ncbi:MgtC/SapB family protein [Pseudochelatococcus sp. B33]
MNASSLLFQLGLALAIGLLVGTERHWRERDDAPGARTAGIRTFGITGLLGGLTGTIAETPGFSAAILIGAALVAFSGVFGAFKWREAEAQHDFSVTTVVAGQATFLLGVLAALDHQAAAAGAAIALTALLASRESLHAFVQRLTWPELRSAIFLLAMAFIVLPLLPDRAMGPYDALNPSEIWIFAIALAGVSFVGYVAVKVFGSTRGPLIAGLAGGLVSSTAVALTSARDSLLPGANIRAIASGALAASAVSVARGAALVVIFAPAMLGRILPALAATGLVLTLAAVLCALTHAAPAGAPADGELSPAADAPQADNPFEIGSVLKLAAIIAFATVAARVASALFGDRGMILVSVIMGFVDIDSVILSITRLAQTTQANAAPAAGLSDGALELAILLAIAANIVGKAIYSVALGSRRFGLLITGVSALALAAGVLAAGAGLV